MILQNLIKTKKKGHCETWDIDAKDKLSLTCLMKASINNHIDIVNTLLRFGANPRIKTDRCESSLTLAVMQGHLEICEKLIIAQANVNEIDLRKRTPLLKAALHNSNFDLIKLLMDNGANPEIADDQGNTPLHAAAQRGSVVVADYLVSLGANPYATNAEFFVPYEMCTNLLRL